MIVTHKDIAPSADVDASPKYPCRAAGGRLVTLQNCADITARPVQNTQHCTTCSSPNRKCRACVLSGFSGPSPVVSAITGLCDFHTTHGERALRVASLEEEEPVHSRLRYRGPSTEPTNSAFLTARVAVPAKPVPRPVRRKIHAHDAVVFTEQERAYALQRIAELSEHLFRILRLAAEGKSYVEINSYIGSARPDAAAGLHELNKICAVPIVCERTPEARDLRRRLLTLLYREHLAHAPNS